MATLDELCAQGILRRIGVRLSRREQPNRQMYSTPEFFEWLTSTVRSAVQFAPEDLAPRHQAHDFLRSYQIRLPFNVGRTFKRMRPRDRDVFEFTTPDLRIFGWFYRIDIFVAVRGDFMENTHSDETLYERYRDEVVAFRDDIDLDPPKHTPGASEDDVLSV